MSPSDLENRLPEALERAAHEVVAPPSDVARGRIHRRARALERRSHVRMALAGAALVTLGLGGALSLRDDGREQVTAGPANDPGQWADWEPPVGGDGLPAFVLEGREPSYADEDGGTMEPEGQIGPEPTSQVFRRPGDYAGPTVYVGSGPGLEIPQGDAETVQVAGHPANLSRYNPAVPALGWQLPDGRAVYIRAWGLSDDELLSFAGGLRERPRGGFDATVLPQQLVEDPIEGSAMTEYAIRELRYELPASHVEIFVNLGGEREFEGYVQDRFDSADQVEQLVVLDRPAVLIHYRGSQRWSLQWRHTTTARVEVVVEGGDRANVDRVLAGLHEVDQATWRDLLARHAG